MNVAWGGLQCFFVLAHWFVFVTDLNVTTVIYSINMGIPIKPQANPRKLCVPHSAWNVKNWHISMLLTTKKTKVWKFTLGENGACFPSPPAFEWPLHLPIDRKTSEKIFQSEPEIFAGGSSNLFRRGFCIGIHLAGGRMVSHPCQKWHNVIRLDTFCRTARQKRRDVTYWFYYVFPVSIKTARQLLPVQGLCHFSVKIFLPKNLNKIDRLQNFYYTRHFGTADAITYIEREQNLRFIGGSVGYRQ